MSVTAGPISGVKADITCRNGSGPISAPGLQVGDSIVGMSQYGFVNTFEQIVSVADQLQQTQDIDLTGCSLTIYFMRGV